MASKKAELARRRLILEHQRELGTAERKDEKKEEIKEKKLEVDWRVHGLLECCQQTAPGCRHLCSRNVTKEQVSFY